MPAIFCTTKAGVLRLVHEGREYLLDQAGLELPAALADSIRTHVNVVVGAVAEKPPEEVERAPKRAPKKASDDE